MGTKKHRWYHKYLYKIKRWRWRNPIYTPVVQPPPCYLVVRGRVVSANDGQYHKITHEYAQRIADSWTYELGGHPRRAMVVDDERLHDVRSMWEPRVCIIGEPSDVMMHELRMRRALIYKVIPR